LELLSEARFRCIDIAPTKIWPNWIFDSPAPTEYKRWLSDYGFACAGMQSIFFGTQSLNVFGDTESWLALRQHFERVCRMASELEVGAVVFGAPANRDPGGGVVNSWEQALNRFGVLGDLANANVTKLCIEPVPSHLGGRFLSTTVDTMQFVKELAHPAVKVNLDTAVLTSEGCIGDEAREVVVRNIDLIGHVHVSEPDLGGFDSPQGAHREIAEALRACQYNGGVAIEMRAHADSACARANLAAALAFVSNVYS
jgi:D-psicose/D-tagatose/L-ribulose 3-epimerase